MKKTIVLVLAAAVCFGLLLACESEPEPAKKTEYKVTFELNDAGVTGAAFTTPAQATRKVVKGKELGALPAVTSTTHDLDKWTTGSDDTTDTVTAATKVSKAMTVYAQWKLKSSGPERVIVSFDPNGGTPTTIASIQVEKGKSATQTTGVTWPQNPTKAPQIFAGWFKTSDGDSGGTEVTAETVINEATALKARWATGFTVTFDVNMAEWATGATVTPSSLAIVEPHKTLTEEGKSLPTPTWDGGWGAGMEFKGWFKTKAAAAADAFDADTEVTASLSVYAKWEFTAGDEPTLSASTANEVVHNAPEMYNDTAPNGAQTAFDGTDNTAVDGSMTLEIGAIRYHFPEGYENYDFVTLEYVHNGDLQIVLKRGETSSPDYTTRSGGSQYVELPDSGSIEFFIYSQGTTVNPGITFQQNQWTYPDSEGTVKWVKATFKKGHAPYNVTFNLDYTDAPDNPDAMVARESPLLNGAMPVPAPRAGFRFDGWFAGDTRIMALTEITANNTELKAKWTDVSTLPKETAEQIDCAGTNNSGVPVYRFTLTGSDTWADIKEITYKIRVDDMATYNATSGRMHILGALPAGNFSSGTMNLQSGWNSSYRMVQYQPSGANTVSSILGHNAEPNPSRLNQWVEYKLVMDGSKGDMSAEGKAANIPAASATGPFYFGVALGTNSVALTYYIKDVALIKTDNTLIPADPATAYLSGDSGPTLGELSFTASGTKAVTRAQNVEIVKYEDGFIPMP